MEGRRRRRGEGRGWRRDGERRRMVDREGVNGRRWKRNRVKEG